MRNYLFVFIAVILSVSCSKSNDEQVPLAQELLLNCSAASVSSSAVSGVVYSGTITLPYTGGNGETYNTGAPVGSSGVAGLTATLQGGTLMNGSGNISFAISGIASTAGTASFAISFKGKSCIISVAVNDPVLTQYGTPFSGVPDAPDAVIYQVNMRAFSATRNFQGVIARLDSIRALGVNVIYLMPVYPVGILNSINSPYCVKDYKAVGNEYGTLTDLRNLVDGAHSRGMAVIMDWVANHTAWDHAWITNHREWYVQDAGGTIQSPPPGWADVAQLNFANSAMRLEMISNMKYWVYTANCDGFRFDYADGPPNDFWAQAIDTLRNITTHKLLMLAESANTTKYAAGFDYIFGFNYYGNLKSIYNNNVSVQTIDALNNAEYAGILNDQQRVVRYLTNHDVNHSDGPAINLFGGNTGSMAAFVATAYMKAVPMIYNGQEVGTSYPLSYLTLGTPVNWNQNQSMVEEYKRIIAFRNSSLAIRRGVLTSHSSADICAFTKEQGAEKVFVASNVRNTAINYTLPPGVANMTWTDAMSGTAVSLTSQLNLQPYSYIVLRN